VRIRNTKDERYKRYKDALKQIPEVRFSHQHLSQRKSIQLCYIFDCSLFLVGSGEAAVTGDSIELSVSSLEMSTERKRNRNDDQRHTSANQVGPPVAWTPRFVPHVASTDVSELTEGVDDYKEKEAETEGVNKREEGDWSQDEE